LVEHQISADEGDAVGPGPGVHGLQFDAIVAGAKLAESSSMA